MPLSEDVQLAAQPRSGASASNRNYVEELDRGLSSGEFDRQVLRRFAREAAAGKVSFSSALESHFHVVESVLSARLDSPGRLALRRSAEAAIELAAAFEEAADLDRRTHLRVASAYAQKIREVDALLDSLPAISFLKDDKLRYTAVNRLYCEALGKSREQILLKRDEDLFPEELASRLAAGDREVMTDRAEQRREQVLSLDGCGCDRVFLFIKAPVLDDNGAPTALIGVGFDLTETLRAEARQAQMAAGLESIGEAVLVASAGGRIEYVNPAFEAVTGFTSDEAIGRTLDLLASDEPDLRARQAIERAFREGTVWRGTLTYRKKSGEAFYADQVVSQIQGPDGKPTHTVIGIRDVTDQRRVLEALQRALMVKSELTSMVSHELRTPLTAIKEAVDIVAEGVAGAVNERQLEFLTLAKRNVDRLHRLINDTLDFSKLERGEFRLRIEPCDLNQLIREIVRQQRLPAQKHGLRLETSLDPAVPEVRVDCDRISQVLVNLINNAICYTEKGWIEVASWKQDDEVIVKVQDTGPGIDAQHLKHIFEAFVQLSTGLKRKPGGTGLGLAICKRLIELHGGRIWVESEVGGGSAFYFALGLGDEAEDEE